MPSEYHHRGAKRAREAREELGLGQDGPLEDLLRTVEEQGESHVLVLALPEDVAGAYVRRPGMPLLVVSGNDHVARQRFTLAHEFGHFRMNHEDVVDRQSSMSGYDHDPCEVEANAFAAEFLVPKKAILAWDRGRRADARTTLEDVVGLAWEYGVSAQMMRYRLWTCGILRDASVYGRIDAEIADGLHVDVGERLGLEPVEDSLGEEARRLPRLPRALRGTLFGDLLAGEIDPGSYAGELGSDKSQVQRMLVSLGLDRAMAAGD